MDDRGGTERDVHSIIEGIPKDKPASLDGLYGLIDGPFQGIYPCVPRDPGWLGEMLVFHQNRRKGNVAITYLFDRQGLAPVRRRSWHLA